MVAQKTGLADHRDQTDAERAAGIAPPETVITGAEILAMRDAIDFNADLLDLAELQWFAGSTLRHVWIIGANGSKEPYFAHPDATDAQVSTIEPGTDVSVWIRSLGTLPSNSDNPDFDDSSVLATTAATATLGRRVTTEAEDRTDAISTAVTDINTARDSSRATALNDLNVARDATRASAQASQASIDSTQNTRLTALEQAQAALKDSNLTFLRINEDAPAVDVIPTQVSALSGDDAEAKDTAHVLFDDVEVYYLKGDTIWTEQGRSEIVAAADFYSPNHPKVSTHGRTMGSDGKVYILADDVIILPALDDVADATALAAVTGMVHGNVVTQTDTGDQYRYDESLATPDWALWNGTDAIAPYSSLDPVTGVSSWIEVGAEQETRLADVETSISSIPQIASPLVKWTAAFRQGGAIDAAEPSQNITANAVRTGESVYTITLDEPIPDNAYLRAEGYDGHELRQVGYITIIDPTTVEVQMLNSISTAELKAHFRFTAQSGNGGPRSIDGLQNERGSDDLQDLIDAEPVTAEDVAAANVMVVTNLPATALHQRSTEIYYAVTKGTSYGWSDNPQQGQQRVRTEYYTGDVVIDQNSLVNPYPVIYEITDGGLILKAGGGDRNQFGRYSNIMVRRVGTVVGPAITVTSTGDPDDFFVRWTMDHICVLESTGKGMVIEAAFLGVITGLWILDCVGDGLECNGNGTTDTSFGVNSLFIAGGEIGNTEVGVVLENCKCVNLHGVAIEGNRKQGVLVKDQVEVSGFNACYFEKNGKNLTAQEPSDIQIGASNSDRALGFYVRDGRFTNSSSTLPSHEYPIGVNGSGHMSISIDGNRFRSYEFDEPVKLENGAKVVYGPGNHVVSLAHDPSIDFEIPASTPSYATADLPLFAAEGSVIYNKTTRKHLTRSTAGAWNPVGELVEVDTLAQLFAGTAEKTYLLKDVNRQGFYTTLYGDYTSEVTNDPIGGLYVTFPDDLTGATKVKKRVVDSGVMLVDWWSDSHIVNGVHINAAITAGARHLSCSDKTIIDVNDVSITSPGSGVIPVRIDFQKAFDTRCRIPSMFTGNWFTTDIHLGYTQLLPPVAPLPAGRTSIFGNVRRFNANSKLTIDYLNKSSSPLSSVIYARAVEPLDMYSAEISIGVHNSGATEFIPTSGAPMIDIDQVHDPADTELGEIRDNVFHLPVAFGMDDNPLIRLVTGDNTLAINNTINILEGENARAGFAYMENARDTKINIMSYDTDTLTENAIHLVDCQDAVLTIHRRKGDLPSGVYDVYLEGDCDNFRIDAIGYDPVNPRLWLDDNNGIIWNKKNAIVEYPGSSVRDLSTGGRVELYWEASVTRTATFQNNTEIIGISTVVLSDTSLYTFTTTYPLTADAVLTATPTGGDIGQRNTVASRLDPADPDYDTTVLVRATATASGNNFTSQFILEITEA